MQANCVYAIRVANYGTLAPLAKVIIISQFQGLSEHTI